MLKEIFIAIEAYSGAHRFIRKHRLWKWVLLPGFFYMLFFSGGIYLFVTTASEAIHWFNEATGLHGWLERSDSGLLNFFVSFGEIIITIILLVFYFSFFKYFWLILGSPAFAYLSEKTDAILHEKEFKFNYRQMLRDILRGIALAIRNTLWQTVYMLAILILALIPVIGWAAPVLSLIVESYYYGFSMLDYSLERQEMKPSQSSKFVANHRGLAVGNGMVFYVMHLFPVAGWVLAPAYAVIAATISIYRQTHKNE